MLEFLVILLSTFPGVNAIEKCHPGYYVDVKPAYYSIYEPIEKLSNYEIQIDSNY